MTENPQPVCLESHRDRCMLPYFNPSKSMNNHPGHSRLPLPDPAASAHSQRLMDQIRDEIDAAGGHIPFVRFMELALYAPYFGYYRSGTRKFGAGGDFVTAPELSPLFSRCLARQCQEILGVSDGAILELGAGTGVMAADVLQELETLGILLPSCINYYILELSGELRERQHATLQERVPHLLPRIRWLDNLPASGFRGIILANEVMDAMPVQRFCITEQGIAQMAVSWEADTFIWRETQATTHLMNAVKTLQDNLGFRLPPGYISEFNPHLDDWIKSLSKCLEAGAILLIDYGYPRREYYHPQRTDGTLLCHYRHRVHADPLLLPGLQDITASVDFSAVADAARAAELTVAGYTSQTYFLFGCGLAELLAQVDPGAGAEYLELTRQVKLLTLPSEMGERFKAMALTRGLEAPLRGFTVFDERERL